MIIVIMGSAHTISSLLILQASVLINGFWFEEGKEIPITLYLKLAFYDSGCIGICMSELSGTEDH